MTDLQAGVPQHVEHVLDDLLQSRGLLAGQQEHQVDVGERRQFAATVAAGRDHRHLVVAAIGIGGRIDVRVREVVDAADQLIDEERVRLDHLGPGDRLRLEPPADLADAAVERRLEDLQGIGARARALRHPTAVCSSSSSSSALRLMMARRL